jgi:phosphoribosylformimino-5-aminoimidazole carboxamide ribotide isomerase
MQVIPVLDIRHGQAVHAVAGDRAHYGPLRSILHGGTDPITLAKAGRDRWGLDQLYLADLDAILGEKPPAFEVYGELARLGLTLWVDSGVRDARDVPQLVEAGVERVIVALETVRGPEALAEIVAEFGSNRMVFSLDLRGTEPMIEPSANWGSTQAREIASRVVEIGIRRIIHLDLAAVGTGRNSRPDGRGNTFDVEWLVGGGISTTEDLARLARIGAWGVLVGSALHDGRLTSSDCQFL